MKVTTKKIQLKKKFFLKIAMKNVLKEQWWVFLLFLLLLGMTFVIPSHWWWIGALTALALYFLFWLIQFVGVTQLEQGKIFFQRLLYEITSKEILIRVDARQGMPIKWKMIKGAVEKKNYFLLKLSKVQFIYWPHKAFKNDNERKFIRTVLKNKGYL